MSGGRTRTIEESLANQRTSSHLHALQDISASLARSRDIQASIKMLCSNITWEWKLPIFPVLPKKGKTWKQDVMKTVISYQMEVNTVFYGWTFQIEDWLSSWVCHKVDQQRDHPQHKVPTHLRRHSQRNPPLLGPCDCCTPSSSRSLKPSLIHGNMECTVVRKQVNNQYNTNYIKLQLPHVLNIWV